MLFLRIFYCFWLNIDNILFRFNLFTKLFKLVRTVSCCHHSCYNQTSENKRFVQFLDVLDTLNEDGRKKVMEYTNDLSQIDHYKRDKYKKKRKERLI